MEKEDKELLLKDLCGRLPYGVKVKVTPVPSVECKHVYFNAKVTKIDVDYIKVLHEYGWSLTQDITTIRPYLFPLSSMTDEQKEELIEVIHPKDTAILAEILRKKAKGESVNGYGITYHAADWCNKNHFDYRGLIPMNLAIDAINLNIY